MTAALRAEAPPTRAISRSAALPPTSPGTTVAGRDKRGQAPRASFARRGSSVLQQQPVVPVRPERDRVAGGPNCREVGPTDQLEWRRPGVAGEAQLCRLGETREVLHTKDRLSPPVWSADGFSHVGEDR